MDYHEIQQILGSEAENLFAFNNPKISEDYYTDLRLSR
jgi:hypothetical protein